MISVSSNHHLPPALDIESGLPIHFADNRSGDHEALLEEAINGIGLSPSEYFTSSGIFKVATDNDGICGFMLAGRIALYQNTNSPIVDESSLEPSLAPNAAMFGRFMGTLEVGDPERERKRANIEAELGTFRFFDNRESQIRRIASREFAKLAGTRHDTAQFVLRLIAAVVGRIPGLLDFHTLSLDGLLQQAEHWDAVSGFFETASQIISAGRALEGDPKKRLLAFVQALLHGNIADLNAAPEGNLVMKFFSERHLTGEGIDGLDVDAGAELATIIVATYDTTALSLLWLLTFLAQDQSSLNEMREIACRADKSEKRLAELDLYVLEAIRLGGSNPTALWRKAARDFVFSQGDKTILVPKGTQIWLDRLGANRDPSSFPNPNNFDVTNMRYLRERQNISAASIVSRARYEINSFSMINTYRNPRKCPGRLFSIRLLSIILDELLRTYQVKTQGVDTSIRAFSAMPQPRNPGWTELALR